MSSTQEKLIDKYSNPEWWKQNPEATKDDWWRYFSEDVPITLEEARQLIESAKREGKKEALEKLVSLLHIYMDDKTPPGGEWPKQDMVVVVSFIESLVAQLEQSEESI